MTYKLSNIKKGSRVSLSFNSKRIQGKVIKKYTAPEGSVNVPKRKRTIVEVYASGQTFIKRPSELRRLKYSR